jgi:hypothetical protein
MAIASTAEDELAALVEHSFCISSSSRKGIWNNSCRDDDNNDDVDVWKPNTTLHDEGRIATENSAAVTTTMSMTVASHQQRLRHYDDNKDGLKTEWHGSSCDNPPPPPQRSITTGVPGFPDFAWNMGDGMITTTTRTSFHHHIRIANMLLLSNHWEERRRRDSILAAAASLCKKHERNVLTTFQTKIHQSQPRWYRLRHFFEKKYGAILMDRVTTELEQQLQQIRLSTGTVDDHYNISTTLIVQFQRQPNRNSSSTKQVGKYQGKATMAHTKRSIVVVKGWNHRFHRRQRLATILEHHRSNSNSKNNNNNNTIRLKTSTNELPVEQQCQQQREQRAMQHLQVEVDMEALEL